MKRLKLVYDTNDIQNCYLKNLVIKNKTVISIMSQSIVELNNVNIYQGNSLILGDINLSVNKGEFV